MASLKDIADATDVWINVVIKAVIAVLVGAVLFFPHSMPILNRVVVKSSEFNVEGVKFQVIDAALTGKGVEITDDGKLTIGGVDVSVLPDQIAMLRQSVLDLNGQIAKLNDTIAKQQQLLARASTDLDSAKPSAEPPCPPAGDAAANPAVKCPPSEPKLAALIAETAKTANLEKDATAAIAQSAADVVQQATPLPGIGFGIVFGADKTPQEASDKIKMVTRPPVSADPVILYKRQGSWRSVAYFGTRNGANSELAAIKSVKQDAYVVDISSWCPTPVLISAAQAPDKVEEKDCRF